MKLTFDEKQMQKDSLYALCDAIHKIGSMMIDQDLFDHSTCPLTLFNAAKDVTMVEVMGAVDKLSPEQVKKMSENMTEKYTKIDRDGK